MSLESFQPGNFSDAILERLLLQRRLRRNPELQLTALALCERDLLRWVNDYVWTFDPREDPSVVPMMLWPKQEECLGWILELESDQEEGVLEKSRDGGASWLVCAYMVHRWLFRPGFAGGIGSRKLELVDCIGDRKAMFPKLRIILDNLPFWMLPRDFNRKIHDNFAKLINPNNGSTITGEGGDDIGRGDRTTIYAVDEAAFLEHGDSVEGALSQTSRAKLWLSTVHGMGNMFARKRHSGRYRVFIMDWRDDPRKNAWILIDAVTRAELARGPGGTTPPVIPQTIVKHPWYEREREKYEHNPVLLAQEVDRDYTASIEGLVFPKKWVLAAVNLPLAGVGIKKAGLDVGGGAAESVYCGRHGPKVLRVEGWIAEEEDPVKVAWRAADLAHEDGIEKLTYDSVSLGSGVGGAYRSALRPVLFRWKGLNVGMPPSKKVWPDGLTSADKFKDRKAELYFLLKLRFQKTYLYATEGRQYKPDELISIPNDPVLIEQLCSIVAQETENGKYQIEKKEHRKKRGLPSPDRAEALMLSEDTTDDNATDAGAAGGESAATSGLR